jgi:hypothetical protein
MERRRNAGDKRMQKTITIISVFIIALFTLNFSSVCAQDSEMKQKPASPIAAITDLIFVRPLSVIGSGLTTSLFLISLPVTYPIDRAYEESTLLVERPWQYTANRSLGIFRHEENITEVTNKEIDQLYGEFLHRTNAEQKPINLE